VQGCGPKLQTLELLHCSQDTLKVLAESDHINWNLKEFAVSSSNPRDKDLVFFLNKHGKDLKILRMTRLKDLKFKGIHSLLSELNSLEELDVSDCCRIGDQESMDLLEKCRKSLKTLKVQFIPEVTFGNLNRLRGKFKNLLHVTHNCRSSKGVNHLVREYCDLPVKVVYKN